MKKNVLKGPAGKALEKTIANRFKQVDYKLLSEPFRLRNENDGAWRCEFWGKVIRPAITCAYMTDDQQLKKIIDESVADILGSQTPDGCISSYPYELQLKDWDIWGRKYSLLGLIRYYELLNHDPAILEACCRALDHFISQVGPDKKMLVVFALTISKEARFSLSSKDFSLFFTNSIFSSSYFFCRVISSCFSKSSFCCFFSSVSSIS